MLDTIRHLNFDSLGLSVEGRQVIDILLNIIESQASEIASLKLEVLSLKDEINRLKSEDGLPKIPKRQKVDISSPSKLVKAEGKSSDKKVGRSTPRITRNGKTINSPFWVGNFGFRRASFLRA